MKPRYKKVLAVSISILALLIAAAAFLIPKLIDPNRYNTLIVSKLEEALGGKVTLGHIRWSIAEDIRVEVDGFLAIGATAFPIDFEIPHLSAEVSIIPLFSKKVIIEELFLNEPIVTVRVDNGSRVDTGDGIPGTTEIEGSGAERQVPAADLAEETLSAAGGEKASDFDLPVEIFIKKLYFKGGRFTLEDVWTSPGQKIAHNFRDVFMEGVDVLSRKMAFKVSMIDEADPGLGPIKASGTFSGLTKAFGLENPKLIIEGSLPFLGVDVVKPYLTDGPMAAALDGSLSLEINCEYDFGDCLNIVGTLDLTSVSYTDTAMWEGPLPSTETKITYNVGFDHDDLAVKQFGIMMGSLSLSGQALVEDWRTEPVLKRAALGGALPLKEIIPLVPWVKLAEKWDVLRVLLERGGRVTIEKATLSEMSLDKGFDFESALSGLRLTARVSGLSLRLLEDLPAFEDVGGSIELENSVFSIREISGQMGKVQLPQISADITDLSGQPEISAHLKGPLMLGDIADESMLAAFKKSGVEKIQGTAEMDLVLQLDSTHPEDFRLDGTVKLRDFNLETSHFPALLEGLNADVAFAQKAVEIKCSSNVRLPAAEGSTGGNFTVELNGRVINWYREPAVTLRRMRTSEIKLPWLMPIVPWDALGKSTEIVREILLAGGGVVIENLTFSKLDFSKPAEDPGSLFQDMEGAVRFDDVALPTAVDWLPGFGKITGRAKLEKGVLTASRVSLKTGLLSLPDVDFRATRLTGLPKLSVQAKGPLRLERGGKAMDDLLMQYGLRTLSVDAHTDLIGHMDLANPDGWDLSGTFILNRISAETYPEGIVLDDLRGKVSLKRKMGLDVTIEEFSGLVDQAPFRVDGQLSKVGTPQMLIDVEGKAEQLDLGNVAALMGPLKARNLTGTLDMDIDIYLPCADPRQTRLKGVAKLTGFGISLADQGITIKSGNSELALAGDLIQFRDTTFLANDQEIRLSGQVKNPVEPEIIIHVKSPDLDLNRLIARQRGESTSQEEDGGEEASQAKKAHEEGLVDLDRNMKMQVHVEVSQGRYGTQEFRNLHGKADYEKGLFKSFDMGMDIAEGEIFAAGTADFRDPAQIGFTLDPDIKNVKLELITSLLGTDKTPANGPLTLSGHLKGQCGSMTALFASLRGDLEWDMGSGRLTAMGPIGSTLAKTLSFISINVVQVRKMMKDLRGEGMSFHEITGTVSFDSGTATVEGLLFDSKALDFFSSGTVDLVNQQLDMASEVRIFKTLDKALDRVPLVGKASSRLTNIYLTIKGPWTDPKIQIVPGRTFTEPVKEILKTPKKMMGR